MADIATQDPALLEKQIDAAIDQEVRAFEIQLRQEGREDFKVYREQILAEYKAQMEERRNSRDFEFEYKKQAFANSLSLAEERRKDVRLQMELQQHFAELSLKYAKAAQEWTKAKWVEFQRRARQSLVLESRRERAVVAKAARKLDKLHKRLLWLRRGTLSGGQWRSAANAFRQLEPLLFRGSVVLWDKPRTYSIEEFFPCLGKTREASTTPALTPDALLLWQLGKNLHGETRGLIARLGTPAWQATQKVIWAIDSAQQAELAAMSAHRKALKETIAVLIQEKRAEPEPKPEKEKGS